MSANNIPNGNSTVSTQKASNKLNNPSSSSPIHDASTLSDVRAGLAALHRTYPELGRLDLLRANLGSQVIATRSISNGMLSSAADTAGRLSSRVKELDLEKDRVQQTLKVVEQVAELKACVHGVVGSMGAPQDWEAAAGYISRASKVPEPIIRGGFAASMVPSVEVPDAPWGVAGTARATLKATPGDAGKRDGFFYANALTKLFEHIAQIVESHGGLVERHYGEGKMVKVIERLQMEADVQGGIILDSWGDERSVDRKLTDAKSYPFSFLVQSFLPPQRTLTGTPRVNSPAIGGGTNSRNSEDEGVDMKEVDALLSEISIMLGRWSLYSKFLASKCRNPDTPEDAPLSIPEVVTKSNLGRKISSA
ncbi:Conserved oligomeric Golgi complex subunit 4 [Daldinia childiae]|uniref:Conserved oligomeric Golgi complex subunit 4 n=1 Tax=Daldinia childiae TaxID=326645 RepID=UPI00144737EB|nr:Conserved oligomeric Golgi complex subunit 4 [Daldinia childiae]KAF3066496.1 Conserved oligomeric Golgi complex subunit 4 [Daldinia childiae]